MRLSFPAMKFVPPRSKGGKSSGQTDGERRTPPLIGEPVSERTPAPVKRPKLTLRTGRQQTTLLWHKPRTLDLVKARTAKSIRGPSPAASAAAVAMPSRSREYNVSRPDRAASLAWAPFQPPVDEGSSSTPETPGGRGRKALVMVAETPVGTRRRSPLEGRHGFDHPEEGMACLRVPDTQERAELPTVAAEAVTSGLSQGGNGTRSRRRSYSSGNSSDESLSSPLLIWRKEGGGGKDVQGKPIIADPGVSASSSSGGSESPDLLRSYAMGAEDVSRKSEEPKRTVAAGNRGAAVGSILAQTSGEESDSGSESPDLLPDYRRGVGQEPKRAVPMIVTKSTSEVVSNSGRVEVRYQNLPGSFSEISVPPQTAPGAQGLEPPVELRQGTVPRVRSKKRPRQEYSQPGPCNRSVKLGVSVRRSASPRAVRCPPPPSSNSTEHNATGSGERGPAAAATLAPAATEAEWFHGEESCGRKNQGCGAGAAPVSGHLATKRKRSGTEGVQQVRCGTAKSSGGDSPPAAGDVCGENNSCFSSTCKGKSSARQLAVDAATSADRSGPCGAGNGSGTRRDAPESKHHPTLRPASIGPTSTGTATGHESNTISLRRHAASRPKHRDSLSAPSPRGAEDTLASRSGPEAAERAIVHPSARGLSSGSNDISRDCVVPAASHTTSVAAAVAQTPSTAKVVVGQAKSTQSRSEDRGSATDKNSSTPPERRFENRHQQLYKSATAGKGRGSRGRGRGRGGGVAGVGRGGKRRSAAPVPAQARVVGDWRTERGKKGERPKRFYITRTGQRLTGQEAHRAAQEDREALAANGGKTVADRSTIMRIGQGEENAKSPPDASGGERYLHDDALRLTTYGIPEQMVASYEKRGVRRLFPWQAHCLRVDEGKPLSGGNLVYSAPTSGGKTLVAELLLLRALLQHNGTMALLVVPFIALAMEKRDYLREVWAPLQLNVQAFHGSEGGDDGSMDGVNVAVCTMEKANSIVNRLAEETRLEALSAVVVDEMHLIGDGQRGFILELMLSKLRMVCPAKVQLVCLSATLPNIDSLAKWLDASLYKTTFRPVELQHRVCKGRVVYKPSVAGGGGTGGQPGDGAELVQVGNGGIRKVGQTSPATDPDGVVDLVKDALSRDMSVLVFCATKRWCQTTAALLAKEILAERARTVAEATATIATRTTRFPPTTGLRPREKAMSVRTSNGRDGEGKGQGSRLTDTGAPLPSTSQREEQSTRGKGDALLHGFVPAKSVVIGNAQAKPPHRNLRATSSGSRGGSTTTEGNLRTSAVQNALRGKGTIAAATADASTAAAGVRERLRETPVGLDAELAHLVEAGVAFHHSGLVVEERGILEDAFRQGSLRVLVATSTLAAGVNLPAHRVIIRSPHIGIGMLDSTRYHQMAGRSGRAGVSRGQEDSGPIKGVNTASGESFLIIPNNDKLTIPEASKLISAPLPKLESALRGAKGGGLERALLEVVVSKTVNNRAGATRFVSNTFLAEQVGEETLTQACNTALEFLVKHNFITVVTPGRRGPEAAERDADGYGVAPTQLGQATFFSGLSPSAAVDVYRSLDKACEHLVVATDLHALYLLTPLDGLEPDWARFREEYTGWREEDPARVVGKAVGIEEGVLVNAASHTSPRYGERYYQSRGSKREVDLQPYRRFFAALVLQQAVEEVPIRNMAGRLGIERGTLQALQKEASVFCGMVVCFCRHLQWHELANVLYSFQDRLGYSAKPELLPLVRLSRDLPPFRARALLEAGYPTPLELAGADRARVAEVFLRCVPFRSAGWDESVERYQWKQARHLADNVVRLANAEILRQLRLRLSSATANEGVSSLAKDGQSCSTELSRRNQADRRDDGPKAR